MTKSKQEDKERILSPQEAIMHHLTMLTLKATLMNNTTKGTPIPEEAIEMLTQEIPMFNMTPVEKITEEKPQETSQFPPNPMYLRFSNILKGQIVEDLFERVAEQKRVRKKVRSYVA